MKTTGQSTTTDQITKFTVQARRSLILAMHCCTDNYRLLLAEPL